MILPRSESNIKERYPDWDGCVETLVDFMNSKEGNFYEIWFNPATQQWAWLDFYFDNATVEDTYEQTLLSGAAESCYWASSYENFLKEEAERGG